MPDKDKRIYGSTRTKEPTLGTGRQRRFVLASRRRIKTGVKRQTSVQLRVTGKSGRRRESVGKSETQRKILGDRTVIELDSG